MDAKNIASVALFDMQGRMLFGRREDSGKWSLPGGGLDSGESPTDGAVRELLEEAAIRPDVISYLGSKSIDTRKGTITVYAYMGVVANPPEPSAHLDPDHEFIEYRWVHVEAGLPRSIAQNLHSPENVVLELLGLQPEIDEPDEPGEPVPLSHEDVWSDAMRVR